MSRQKRGEPGWEEAAQKWRATMIAKYGSKEKMREAMQINGRKGGSTITDKPKGFACNPALAMVAGAKGGRISRRTGIKNGEGKRANRDIDRIERILEEESGRNKFNA